MHLCRQHADRRGIGFRRAGIAALESGIAASLLALAWPWRWRYDHVEPGGGGDGTICLVHGVAHGLELPEMSSPWTYAAGFVVATATLHALGYAVVRVLPQAAAPLVRLAGVASAATGVWLLAG
ncbi:HupE/UreJ family protein [Pseudomonas sp. PCH446]